MSQTPIRVMSGLGCGLQYYLVTLLCLSIPVAMDTTSVSDDSKSPDEHFAGVGTFPLSVSQPGSVMKKMTRDENFSLQLDPDHVLRYCAHMYST